jgi:site-specific DNA recombinase
VEERFIYQDDGVSGAEFERRHGLQELKATALSRRPPFGVVVVSEQKTLGREASETGYLIKQFAQAGIEIFSYLQAKSLTPKNWLDKAMSAVQSAADEAHREQTRERTHEAHHDKFTKGYVVGGRVFGYRNVDVFNGEDQFGRPLRSHVIREKDPTEAVVVEHIFQLYAAGLGLKAIAKQLNCEGAAHPKPFKYKDGRAPNTRWSHATVRDPRARALSWGGGLEPDAEAR